jgi:RNA polymerase sigma factor (sigma-70 family)
MNAAGMKRSRAEGVLSGANIERYSYVLHAYLMRRLRRAQDTQDFTQEIFTRFIRKCREDPDTVRNPLAFLLGIAGNVVRESLYDARHTRVTFDSDAADEAAERATDFAARGNTAEQVGMRQDILDAIAKLPENYMTAWLLVDGEEMSYEEAARVSGFSRNTISAYVTCARAQLKLILEDYWAKKDRQK